jgi:hypothetical protein
MIIQLTMTIREIISGFRLLLNKGPQSDDSVFTNQYIYHLMKIMRSVLLYERLKDPLFNYRYSLQTLECIELIEADKNECTEKIPSGCKWLKSKNPIPATINDIVTNVYNDRGDKYTRVFSESSKSSKRYSYGSESNYKYLIKNNRLYVPDLNSPKWVKIEGLFYEEDKVKESCGCNCDTMDSDFALEDRLINKMYDLMYDKIVKIFPYMVRDEKNDTNLDDTQAVYGASKKKD